MKQVVLDWVQMNSWWISGDEKIIHNLQFKNDEYGTKSSKISALMIYMALSFFLANTNLI